MNEANLLKHYANDLRECSLIADANVAKLRAQRIIAVARKWQERADKLLKLMKRQKAQGNKIRAFLLKIALKIVILTARFFIKLSIMTFDFFHMFKFKYMTAEQEKLAETERTAEELRKIELKSGIKQFANDPSLDMLIKAIRKVKSKLREANIPDNEATRNFKELLDQLHHDVSIQDELLSRGAMSADMLHTFADRAEIMAAALEDIANNMEKISYDLQAGTDPLLTRLDHFGLLW